MQLPINVLLAFILFWGTRRRVAAARQRLLTQLFGCHTLRDPRGLPDNHSRQRIAVFDALTTATGLAAWWNPATGSGQAGGELRLLMNAPDPLVIHVDEATRPTSVRWTVTDCPFLPDWIGTRPTFSITRVSDDTSELHFRHTGLSEELECIDVCTRSWNHYIRGPVCAITSRPVAGHRWEASRTELAGLQKADS